MGEEYASKLQEDLRKRLDSLCLVHNEPAWHVTEHFDKLRSQVDYDAEKFIEEVQSEKRQNGKARRGSDVNGTRLEFISILYELEKRTGRQQKPQTTASDVYASLEKRVDAFKDSSFSLDDLEDSYVQLAQEIMNETDRVEKRLFGEQTIIYCPHQNPSELGSLVYFGDVFLSKRDVDYLLSDVFPNTSDTSRFESSVSQLLVPEKEPNMINKNSQVVQNLFMTTAHRFAKASKFYYIGKTETEYKGYAADGSTIDQEFISYQRKDTDLLQIQGDSCLDTSANLFDVFSLTRCRLRINNCRLESLHPNLLPFPVTRLGELCLSGVHLDSFDTKLLSQSCNLTALEIQATSYSKDFEFDLELLGPMRKLKSLELTLPGSSWDFSVFKEMTELEYLALEGSSFFYAEKLPRLSKDALEQILSPPVLQSLKLSCFEIETIDRDVFNGCRRLNTFELTRSRISDDTNLGFSRQFDNLCASIFYDISSIKLIHSGIRVLNATSLIGMKSLQHLSLTGNLIVDLPCGVFQDLPSLRQLELDKNRIRHINTGVFVKLDKLKTLKLDGNPIESIEANAFAQLDHLYELSLNGCRLKSIDSEMFKGLKRLHRLQLNSNLIERIEVVAEDGRRINVTKANLSNEERELIARRLFTGLSCLSNLYLKGNKLKKLDLNCFSNLKNVNYLDLSSNFINELSGVAGPGLLFDMSGLDLSDNKLTAIDQSALPKNLYGFDFAKNYLKRLDDDFFANFTQLQSVNLSENELTMTITEATFASSKYGLCSIDVSLNESIRVTEDAISELPDLSTFKYDISDHDPSLLDFDTLRIRKLTPEIVRALKEFPRDHQYHFRQLFAFYLSGCSIKTLTWKSDWQSELDETPNLDHFNLSWLPKASELEVLDFSGNFIETLDDPELFVDLIHIRDINLSDNQLSRIHRDIFECQINLQNIDLSGNNFSCIDMGLFRHLTILWHLNLSSNNISFLSLARLFRTCPRLESLNIADNQLDERSTAEPIDARSSYKLKSLVLANNQLERMDFVRDMTSLTRLNVRGNLIQSVMSNGGENLLGRLRKLTHLNLRGNKISRLTDEMFAHLRGQLEYFDVSDNPLDLNELI